MSNVELASEIIGYLLLLIVAYRVGAWLDGLREDEE